MPSYLETAILNPSSDMVNLIKSVPSSPDIRVHDRSVEEIALEKIQSNSNQKWDTDQENAFFIGDLGEVFRQHLRWKALLPRIEPFFGKFRSKNVPKKILYSYIPSLLQLSNVILTPWLSNYWPP